MTAAKTLYRPWTADKGRSENRSVHWWTGWTTTILCMCVVSQSTRPFKFLSWGRSKVASDFYLANHYTKPASRRGTRYCSRMFLWGGFFWPISIMCTVFLIMSAIESPNADKNNLERWWKKWGERGKRGRLRESDWWVAELPNCPLQLLKWKKCWIKEPKFWNE